ncbi:MAG: molybdopterin-dependent oxidoreductase [Desulfosarcinaceae bacterium]|nr:molybdopterin-dependent oxidoreductase [Desulfosarcinaceae bacterium]
MKIDRRCFLSFAIGGAAGTALSPLPWKLTDDSSIWSQMWPWTPVPPDGESTYDHSTCTLCPGGCGITVRSIDGRAIKIEGRDGHPVNQGGICPLGLAGLQLLYGPTRVKAPLKRVGERGAGKWQRISWESAVAEIAETLAGLRSSGQAHTVAAISSRNRGTVAALMERFLTALGSPNFLRMPTMEDAQELGLYINQGILGSVGYDFENSDFVLSFGAGLIDGWGAPVRMFLAKSAWQDAGAKVVQIESRFSNTAAKADQWVNIRPGSEADLALGIAHVLVAEELYDTSFVGRHTADFDAFQAALADYTPDAVATTTGVSVETIAALAKAFAEAASPVAVYGRGKGQVPGSLKEVLAVTALNALVGNINQPGGMWAIPEGEGMPWPDIETDAVAAEGLQKPRIDGAGTGKFPNSRYLLNRLPAVLAEGSGYGLKALFIEDANPLYSLPDTVAMQAAFAQIPTIVSFASHMDETAAFADYILPNHVYLERYEDVVVTAGLNTRTIGLAQPIMAPLYNTQHVGDTLIQLAQAMDEPVAAAFPWEDYQTCLEESLGDNWDTLEEEGVWTDESFAADPEAGFETTSGDFEFVGDLGADVLTAATAAAEGDATAYPLLLVPYDIMRLVSSRVGAPPFMIKTVPDTILKGQDILVEINPQTAQAAGLADGKGASLETPRGRARVKVHLSEGIQPGVIAMARGLGHTAFDKYLADKGVNVNSLMGAVIDPVSGYDAVWGIRAKLMRA